MKNKEIDYYLKSSIKANTSLNKKIVAMEECSELIQAISKSIRAAHDDTTDYKGNMIEEMADVKICIRTLQLIEDISDEDIDDSKARYNVTKYDESDRHILKKAKNNRGSGSTAQARRILNTLVRIKKYTGNPVYAAKPLMESGRIYMIYRLMQEQEYKSMKDCIVKNKDAIFYRYGRISSIDNWLMRYGEFFQKYKEGGNHGGNTGENKEW